MRDETIRKIEAYQPFNEQEARDKTVILRLLQEDDIFFRTNTVAHMTASAWVLNRQKTKVLMAYHKIYNSWAWLGGHCDGDEDFLAVAIREVKEESGVRNVIPVSNKIFSLEVLTVDGHEKHNEYVSSHLHANVTFLLEADEEEVLRIKEDENTGVSWFGLDEALEKSSEPWFTSRIYGKLNEKLKASFLS